ncbi:MAG: hypothetical protein ACJ735_08845 [Actinomycetes bacterium]
MTGPGPGPDEVDIEAPEADVAEQRVEAAHDTPRDNPTPEVPLDADPADVSEQEREVGYADDDYR